MLDVTSVWARVARHRSKLGIILTSLLLFLAGWQFGRITSPYYAAHPIIFQDRAGSGSGGSLTELTALQDEGRALGSPNTQQAAVAGITAPADVSQGNYVASVNSTLYHHKDCAAAKRINPENQVWFVSSGEAETAGFTPSSCTQQRE